MNYAIVNKNSNRALAIVDQAFEAWFKQNLPGFDIIEIASNGKSIEFNYCQEAIKEDCRRGFKVYDKEGNLFQYIPEQLNRIKDES